MDTSFWHRNNLGDSSSLYLRQHAGQPVHWQEWNAQTLAQARRSGLPLFVSVGYATCHWCHVMASESFSDPATAELLNSHFICIKVDRELRPDVDAFLMAFLQALGGQGGWPLNAFLTPELHPIFALTYAPRVAKPGLYSFADIVEKVIAFDREHRSDTEPFALPAEPAMSVDERRVVADWQRTFDGAAGGYGAGHKFPPHATLLAQLYRLSDEKEPSLQEMARRTLDAMRRGGLHDHLQGGFYRYCVDRYWTIPHFEKMLYDQAQTLWTFALAHKVLGDPADRLAALGVARCLQETFQDQDLFVSAHDADTHHEEGATYVWDYAELKSLLGAKDLERFAQAYDIVPSGNFEGHIHLVRKNDNDVADLERLLLRQRLTREQPAVDRKLLSGQNALTAAAWMMARRLLPEGDLGHQGERTLRQVLSTFWTGKGMARALADGKLHREEFLFDAAATLFALSVAREESSEFKKWIAPMKEAVEKFRTPTGWLESLGSELPPMPASRYDQPLPSGVALAEFALLRLQLQDGLEPTPIALGPAHSCDFAHLAYQLAENRWHWIKTPAQPDWGTLPAHSLAIPSTLYSDCYRGACTV